MITDYRPVSVSLTKKTHYGITTPGGTGMICKTPCFTYCHAHGHAHCNAASCPMPQPLWIWSVRMVHSVAASGHAALRDRPWQGVSHVVLENTSNGTLVILGGSCGHLDSILTGLISCLKDCLRRCTGLGASQGAVQGVSRLWAATLPSLYIAASDCLIRCTGLGASQGSVQGGE